MLVVTSSFDKIIYGGIKDERYSKWFNKEKDLDLSQVKMEKMYSLIFLKFKKKDSKNYLKDKK